MSHPAVQNTPVVLAGGLFQCQKPLLFGHFETIWEQYTVIAKHRHSPLSLQS